MLKLGMVCLTLVFGQITKVRIKILLDAIIIGLEKLRPSLEQVNINLDQNRFPKMIGICIPKFPNTQNRVSGTRTISNNPIQRPNQADALYESSNSSGNKHSSVRMALRPSETPFEWFLRVFERLPDALRESLD